MQAITIDRYGGPEVARLVDIAMPEPRDDEVLIEVACAGINFMDIHTRQGKYAASKTYAVRLPCTLGMEGAGTVVEAGAKVTRVKPGDRVAWCISWGSYAEYACVPEARLALLPDAIGFDVAAASLFQGSTAHYLVHDVAQLKPGSTCLVTAASGSIGQLLIQWACSLGATVFATASTPEKCGVARRLGATLAMLYDDGRFAEAVREATAGRGVDVVFDSVGRTTLRDSFRATRVRGLVVNYGNVSGSVTDLDPLELGETGSLFLTRPRLADHLADAATVQHRADAVFAALQNGVIQVPIVARYSLASVGRAHALIEARQQIGKVVVTLMPAH